MSILSYQYYDTPEGHDIWKKSLVLSRYAAITGFGCASFDTLMYSHTKGVVNTVGRFAWYMGPLVGMASAFAVTSGVARNMRGKDDTINYFLGGVASGMVFGAWQKSAVAAFPVCLLLGFGAIAKKMSIDEGWLFFPEPVHMDHNATSVKNTDYTMLKEVIPKGFRTGPA